MSKRAKPSLRSKRSGSYREFNRWRNKGHGRWPTSRPKANRHPQRDGQVRPDPITANGGATTSDKPVANRVAEVASQSIGTDAV